MSKLLVTVENGEVIGVVNEAGVMQEYEAKYLGAKPRCVNRHPPDDYCAECEPGANASSLNMRV